MTVNELVNENLFNVLSVGNDLSREISVPFCCDLLSVTMSKAPENCCWVTIMANRNTLAVATLSEVSVVILAEGVEPSKEMIEKAKSHDVTVLMTDRPIFEAALQVNELLNK